MWADLSKAGGGKKQPNSSNESSSEDETYSPVRSTSTQLDQLNLQAFIYSKFHPQFTRELEAASQYLENKPLNSQQSPSGSLLPNAHALSRRLNVAINSADKGTFNAQDSKLVQLSLGTLSSEDPALVEPLILDWAESNRRELKQQQRRQHDMDKTKQHILSNQQRAYKHDSKPEEQSSYHVSDDEEWSEDSNTYKALESTLTQWEVAQSIGKHRLPRQAPKAHLLAKHVGGDRTQGRRRVPDAWLLPAPKHVSNSMLSGDVWRV